MLICTPVGFWENIIDDNVAFGADGTRFAYSKLKARPPSSLDFNFVFGFYRFTCSVEAKQKKKKKATIYDSRLLAGSFVYLMDQ